MSLRISHQAVLSTFAAVFLAAALPQASFAASGVESGVWKLNMTQSKFGTGASTIVMQRDTAAKPAAANDANGPHAFLVISNRKVYLAESGDAYATAANGVTNIEYLSTHGMRLTEIGDRVHVQDLCGFRCQSGLSENTITLRFHATTDMSKTPMRELVVLNN